MGNTKIRLSKAVITLLTVQLALPIMSTDIYLPSLRDIGNFFHASHNQVQLTLTAYFIISGFVQLIYGTLSDKFGRRPVLLTSLFIYTLATLFCMFSTTIQMLIIGRCLQAVGAGSAILTFAIVRDSYEGVSAAQMVSYMSAVVAMSPIFAPIVGGYIQTLFSWQWNFTFLFVVALLVLLLGYRLLPETNKYRNQSAYTIRKLLHDYREIIFNRNYLCNSLCAAFAFGTLFAYISGAPFVLLNLMGYHPQSFGWLFATGAIGYVIGALSNGKFVSRFGLNVMSQIGILSLVGGALIMTLLCYLYSSNVISILIPQILCEFGISIVISTSITKALLPMPQYAGAGSALLGFFRFMFAALSSYLVIKFHGTNALHLALIILGFSLFALTCLKLGSTRNKLNILASYV